MAVLRPHPHRGDVVAAGVVFLTLFIVIANLRMGLGNTWSDTVRLIVSGGAAALVMAMIFQPGSGDETPRPYESVLYVGSFILLIMTLVNLASVLGSNGGSGTFVWTGLLLMAYAAWFVSARNSAIMTLLASFTGVIVVLEFISFAFHPHSATPFKWVTLACAIGLALAAVSQRDARRRHAVSLVDATGLTAILLGGFVIVDQFIGLLGGVIGGAFTGQRVSLTGGPDGWEFVLLAFGLALIGYGSIDRERVPQFLGILVLILYLFEAFQPGGRPSLVGWPLILVVAAGTLLAIGLRPRQDLPPEPPVPPPVPPPTS